MPIHTFRYKDGIFVTVHDRGISEFVKATNKEGQLSSRTSLAGLPDRKILDKCLHELDENGVTGFFNVIARTWFMPYTKPYVLYTHAHDVGNLLKGYQSALGWYGFFRGSKESLEAVPTVVERYLKK